MAQGNNAGDTGNMDANAHTDDDRPTVESYTNDRGEYVLSELGTGGAWIAVESESDTVKVRK